MKWTTKLQAQRAADETILARIEAMFADALQIPHPDLDTDFFELGGDSLLFLQVFLSAREEWQVEPDMAYIYDNLITVRVFAQAVILSLAARGDEIKTTEMEQDMRAAFPSPLPDSTTQ